MFHGHFSIFRKNVFFLENAVLSWFVRVKVRSSLACTVTKSIISPLIFYSYTRNGCEIKNKVGRRLNFVSHFFSTVFFLRFIFIFSSVFHDTRQFKCEYFVDSVPLPPHVNIRKYRMLATCRFQFFSFTSTLYRRDKFFRGKKKNI